MKKKTILLLAFVMITLAGFSKAPDYISNGGLIDGKTVVKADLLGLAIRNYGFSAERIINKKLSVNLGVRFIPEGNIPMLSSIQSAAGDAGDYLNDILISSFSFTPELRIYTGKHGYGRGFYLAPYYNYFKFNIGNFKMEEEVDGENYKVMLDGGIKTQSGGLMIGYQWLLGPKKNIVIDWGIFGIHYGNSTGKLTGKFDGFELDNAQQQEFKDNIDQSLTDIPLFKFTTEVDKSSIAVNEKGPWTFLRSNLSIGFRF